MTAKRLTPRTVLTALILCATLGVGQLSHAQTPSAAPTADLTVTVSGLKPKGTLRLGLFASQADYEAGRSVTGTISAVTASSVTFTLPGLPAGTYAIKFYHDANDNNRMDTNPFGMPTEAYGFSNNAKGRFGPADWEKAAFELTAGGGVQVIAVN